MEVLCRWRKDCSVGHISGNSGKGVGQAIGVSAVSPAAEGVGVLCIFIICGSRAIESRRCACFHASVGFNRCIAVFPRYGVGCDNDRRICTGEGDCFLVIVFCNNNKRICFNTFHGRI